MKTLLTTLILMPLTMLYGQSAIASGTSPSNKT
jgi:hypothetical protein